MGGKLKFLDEELNTIIEDHVDVDDNSTLWWLGEYEIFIVFSIQSFSFSFPDF